MESCFKSAEGKFIAFGENLTGNILQETFN